MGAFIDLSGRKFGRLVVLRRDGLLRPARWICKCRCGVTKVIRAGHLRSGHTTSCGCLHRETITAIQTIHGLHKSLAYHSWKNMLSRCRSKSNPKFASYGGRGIRVCKRWENSFLAFYQDMGEKPRKGMSIERKNNNLGYFKSNCIWATPDIQGSNTRRNVLISQGPNTRTIAEWARVTGFHPGTISSRIKKSYGSPLSPKNLKNGNPIRVNGKYPR